MSATPFTDQLMESFAPWVGYDTNGHLTAYLTFMGNMFDEVAAIVYPQGYGDDPGYVPSWSVLLDPDLCPGWALPYLGQFVGVMIPPGTDEATARALINNEQGFQRGTVAAVTAAVKRNLTGTQSVTILERTNAAGDEAAYHFQVIVRPEEVIDVAQLTAAVNAVKPAGVQWTLVQTDGWIISEMEATYTTLPVLESTFHTITGLEQDVPGT